MVPCWVGVGDDPGGPITGHGVGPVSSVEGVGFGDMGSAQGAFHPVVGHRTGSGGGGRRGVGCGGSYRMGSVRYLQSEASGSVVWLVVVCY